MSGNGIKLIAPGVCRYANWGSGSGTIAELAQREKIDTTGLIPSLGGVPASFDQKVGSATKIVFAPAVDNG